MQEQSTVSGLPWKASSLLYFLAHFSPRLVHLKYLATDLYSTTVQQEKESYIFPLS